MRKKRIKKRGLRKKSTRKKGVRKRKRIVLLCLLLTAGLIGNHYYEEWPRNDAEHISVTAPFCPQYTGNENPQSSVDLVADLCGITQFRKRYGTDGAGQRIALIDSGIDLSHRAFQWQDNPLSEQMKVMVYRDYTDEGKVRSQAVELHEQTVNTGGVAYKIGEIVNNAEIYRIAFLQLDTMQPRLFAETESSALKPLAVLVTAQNGKRYNCVYLDTNQNCDFTDETPLFNYAEQQQHITLNRTSTLLNLALTDISSDGTMLQFSADTLGHGTFLAGLMAGDSEDYHGLAPEAQLCVYKIFDRDGKSSQQMLAQAIRQAILDEVDCINLSLSVPKDEPVSEELEEMFYQAKAANIPVIAAAGNYGPGKNTAAYPARTDNVIGVGSYVEPTQYQLDRDLFVEKPFVADYSGRGTMRGAESPMLVAPAGMISTVPEWYAEENLYDYGTSISAAITTAAICHLQQAAENKELSLSVEQIKHLLCSWTENLGFSAAEQGYGALQLGRLPNNTAQITACERIREETIVYDKDDPLAWDFSVLQGQSKSWYVEVPFGHKELSAVMQIDQQLPQNEWEHLIAMGRCYISLYSPDGVLMDQSSYLGASYSDTLITSGKVHALLPKPGVWEIVITSADDLSRYNHLESTGCLQVELK